MRFVIQRVTEAKCEVDNRITGQIQNGFCVLIGVSESDNRETADKMIKKLLGMRIFSDADGKTNLSITDVNGSLLLISQFTLYANCRKGNRPSFTNAGNPTLANELYEYIIAECKREIPIVETGVFGAHMKISLTNDGPFTIILDSEELSKTIR
jgi:D-tyrosyl-tRNA(Tyr) deacylase